MAGLTEAAAPAIVTRVGKRFHIELEGKFPLGTWQIDDAQAFSQIGGREFGAIDAGVREARLRPEVFTFEARARGTYRLRAVLKSIRDDGGPDDDSPTMVERVIPVVVSA